MLICTYSRLIAPSLLHEVCTLFSETVHSFTVKIYWNRFLRIHDRSTVYEIYSWHNISLLIFVLFVRVT